MHHFNANHDDFTGNQSIGRYVLLPGSDGRAQEIAQHFSDLTVKQHPRGHHLYLGNLIKNQQSIAVAALSSGMGGGSMEIILHELHQLGVKRLLRIGTAGSLQPDLVKIGDLINVQGAVRDEKTSVDYMPIEIPALATLEVVEAISQAAVNLTLSNKVHTGIVHCKSSLYAREFFQGPRKSEHQAYLALLTDCGVLASEMETAPLFIQSQFYNYAAMQKNQLTTNQFWSGALLSIVSEGTTYFATADQEPAMMKDAILLALETIYCLAQRDQLR